MSALTVMILLLFVGLIHGLALGYLIGTHRANRHWRQEMVRPWDVLSGRKEGV